MKLDFTTLYIIILLNSVGFALVWGIISISYRSLRAARYWFSALALTSLSGPMLVLGEASQWWNYAGNILVVLSFGLIWQGIRVFLEQPVLWRTLGFVLTISALTMIFFGSSQPANNLIFAMAQLLPIGMALLTLLMAKHRQTGTWIAAGAFGILILGQGSEAATNTLRLAGLMNTETYYEYAAWFLVCAIIGASISNLGFLLMAVDRLRSELHTLAIRDELTGLPNRRALGERLMFTEKRAKRLQRNVTVLMMDLDKFKSINDSYGHSAGDAALKHVAEIAKRSLREVDFLARIGGDEFCILIPDADFDTAAVIADALTTAVASTPFYWRDKQSQLSATIGFNHWDSSSGTPLANSLSHADEDLTKTKRDARKTDVFVEVGANPAIDTSLF